MRPGGRGGRVIRVTSLDDSGPVTGQCRSGHLGKANTYSRVKCNNGWCGIVYTLYFEKDMSCADCTDLRRSVRACRRRCSRSRIYSMASSCSKSSSTCPTKVYRRDWACSVAAAAWLATPSLRSWRAGRRPDRRRAPVRPAVARRARHPSRRRRGRRRPR